jgi:hypothetical protein
MEGSFEAQWQSCGRPGFSSENSSTSLLIVAECADPMTTKYVTTDERTTRSGISFSDLVDQSHFLARIVT